MLSGPQAFGGLTALSLAATASWDTVRTGCPDVSKWWVAARGSTKLSDFICYSYLVVDKSSVGGSLEDFVIPKIRRHSADYHSQESDPSRLLILDLRSLRS